MNVYLLTTLFLVIFCRRLFDGDEEIRQESLESNVAPMLAILFLSYFCMHQLFFGTG